MKLILSILGVVLIAGVVYYLRKKKGSAEAEAAAEVPGTVAPSQAPGQAPQTSPKEATPEPTFLQKVGLEPMPETQIPIEDTLEAVSVAKQTSQAPPSTPAPMPGPLYNQFMNQIARAKTFTLASVTGSVQKYKKVNNYAPAFATSHRDPFQNAIDSIKGTYPNEAKVFVGKWNNEVYKGLCEKYRCSFQVNGCASLDSVMKANQQYMKVY